MLKRESSSADQSLSSRIHSLFLQTLQQRSRQLSFSYTRQQERRMSTRAVLRFLTQ
jgi:Acyl-CoA dehydrogenase, C-terminal domain